MQPRQWAALVGHGQAITIQGSKTLSFEGLRRSIWNSSSAVRWRNCASLSNRDVMVDLCESHSYLGCTRVFDGHVRNCLKQLSALFALSSSISGL